MTNKTMILVIGFLLVALVFMLFGAWRGFNTGYNKGLIDGQNNVLRSRLKVGDLKVAEFIIIEINPTVTAIPTSGTTVFHPTITQEHTTK